MCTPQHRVEKSTRQDSISYMRTSKQHGSFYAATANNRFILSLEAPAYRQVLDFRTDDTYAGGENGVDRSA